MVKMMEDGKIFVYAADAAILYDDTVFAAGYDLVSEFRRERVSRKIRRKDQNLSLGAEILLSACLRKHGVEAYQLRYGEYGKPYLEACCDQKGCWHTENLLSFNLSHSGERVMCVIADQEVGCDVERVKDVNLAFGRRFFAPQEYEQVACLSGKNKKNQMFFRIWTQKESYIKATGKGIAIPMESFCVGQENSIPGYFFRVYDVSDGYYYAVCGHTDHFADTISFLDYQLMIRELGSIMG